MTWPGLVPLTTVARDPILDLATGVGIRSSTFRFAHYDGVDGEFLGDLTPYVGGAVLNHDTGRTVKRNISLTLGIEDASVIDPIRDRIWVHMEVAGREWPLGRYMFTDDLQQVTSAGNLASVQVVDEMFRVDQPISSPFTSQNETVTHAVTRLLDEVDVQIDIDAGLDATSQVSAPIGSTRGQILNTLAAQGGYFSPWMSNHGQFTMIQAVDPETSVPSIDYDTEARVFQASVTRSTDILTAPNRFIVVANGNGINAAEVVGVYDVPSSAPHSIQNRGFVIPHVVDMQVTSQATADAAARAIGIRSTVVERLSFSSPGDPRHDSYDVIIFEGERWLELGWSMRLEAGGAMSHRCVRVYA